MDSECDLLLYSNCGMEISLRDKRRNAIVMFQAIIKDHAIHNVTHFIKSLVFVIDLPVNFAFQD